MAKKTFERLLRWEAGWLILALALRVGFALKLGDRFHQIDEGGYDAAAWHLARTGILGDNGAPLAVPIIPGSFFAFLYLLFGHHPMLARIGQAFAATGLVWMLGCMTRDLTRSQTAGRIALAVSAVYPFFVYYSGMLIAETLYLTALVPGLWLTCLGLENRGKPGWKTAAGAFCLGLSALCRPEGAYIAVLIWAGAGLLCISGRWSWRSWLLALLCWALPLTAACTRNKLATGSFNLDNRGGMALLHGTVLFDLNEIDTGLAMKALEKMDFYNDARNLSPAEQDAVYKRKFLSFMLENPLRTLRQWLRKSLNFWRFYPRTDKVYHETATSNPGAGFGRLTLILISLAFEPWIILGGFAGLWTLRSRWKTLFPLPLFLAATMAVHIISVSQMRYRLPVMPILILGVSTLAAGRLSKRDA